MGNSVPIETAIARIIELYNKAKKEEKEYPTEWAVHKTYEWIHKKNKENKPVRKQTISSEFVCDDWQDELTEYD